MKKRPPSQLMDLFLSISEALGITDDRDIAALADVGPESVANWRSGGVREFKPQKFHAVKTNLLAQLQALRARAGIIGDGDSVHEEAGLSALEIEEGSSPTDLQRQFRDRVVYDYTGHRFLYFEPQGALAWENLIRAGYEQDCWLRGVRDCADMWLAPKRDSSGRATGPIARALRLDQRDKPKGLDILGLGPGEGGKEAMILRRVLAAEDDGRQRAAWLAYTPVDVSIPLLLTAAKAARQALAEESRGPHRYHVVLPVCADFEDGPLSFLQRQRTATGHSDDGVRLIVLLGNVFGNLRDEDSFVRHKLWTLARPGDLVWIEVGLRIEPLTVDPVYRMTEDRIETANDANRRLLLEGPYRRLGAALGRPTPKLRMRVWVREDDDSARIPGSCNFCHDLVIEDESRLCTMLYSRRYVMEELSTWFEGREFEVLGLQRTSDSKGRPRVAHLLLRRRRS